MKVNLKLVVALGCLFAACWMGVASSTSSAGNPAQNTPAGKEAEPAGKAKPPKRPISKVMRGKLASSQLALERLVTEDFGAIVNAANQLLAVTAAAEWRASDDPIYAHHSEQFKRTVQDLKKHAADENLEGATLSYVSLTMNCVECHRFVRNVILISQPENLRP